MLNKEKQEMRIKKVIGDIKPLDEGGATIFFAEADGNLAGRIKMMKWWNQFG